ncbi:MAG: ATPase [Gammaproteobacteria bacterium HGW-Gammaproteobacteria-3]|nr:MAG: ATPase [Gammaproteobacteria bacterium HGW-Gammaproteobacteria-3]
MAILRLKKLTFCGLIDDKAAVLQALQALGGLHLIDLNTAPSVPDTFTSDNAQQVIEALKYLLQCPNRRHQSKALEHFDIDRIANETLDVQARIREFSDRHDALVKRIKEIEPWGNFSLPEAGQLAGYKLWFYIIPRRMLSRLHGNGLIWQIVYRDNLYYYVVVVSKQEPPESAMPVARTHTGSLPLSVLKSQCDQIELALEDLQAKRESLTRWISLMALHLAKARDAADLTRAETMTRDEIGVFAVQAWVPEKAIERFEQFALQNNLALLAEDPAPDDRPPTLLENNRYLAGGEDVVGFYQMPGYYGWDPSLVVFFSFALFFAMILSDAGYAATFAVLLALRWRRLGQSIKGQRLRMLAAITLGVAMLWGMMTGSYFGYSPPEAGVLGAIKFIDMKNYDNMMRLSVAVGVLHIAMANIRVAYHRRYSTQALASLGWAWLVIGGFCLWLARNLAAPLLEQTAHAMLVLGGLCLLLFSSNRAINGATDWLWRILAGLKSLIGITKLFGDVLSYMRLFALGLASTSLAITFNHLAEQVYTAIPGHGLLLSILILLIGHVLNLALSLLSGVVHGLRLNFIEFYNWGVSDEGYPFKAFSKKGVD